MEPNENYIKIENDGAQQQVPTPSSPQKRGFLRSFTDSLANEINKIKHMVISQETEEAFEHISLLFSTFFKDVKYSKADMFLGLLLLESYYKNEHILSGQVVNDLNDLKQAQYFMKFACGSLGSKYIYSYMNAKNSKRALIKGVTGTDKINIEAMCEYTGVTPQDIIHYRFTSTNFDPAHIMAIDHQSKSIVLSIRGTFHIRDVLTDLVATNSPFMQGYAHTGILRSAQNKHNELGPLIIAKWNELKTSLNQDYKVIVVGHSLGAGTAALFTLLFNSSYPYIPIHCYAYAPPCVTSVEIAISQRAKDLITSYALNNDIIPRLSYQSLEHLKTLISAMVENNSGFVNKSFKVLTAGNSLGDDVTNKIAGFLKVNREVKVVDSKNKTLSDQTMLPPGRIFRMHQNGGYKTVGTPSFMIMEESSPVLFNEIIVCGTLLVDHMPDHYETAFSDCIKDLEQLNKIQIQQPQILQYQIQPIQPIVQPEQPVQQNNNTNNNNQQPIRNLMDEIDN